MRLSAFVTLVCLTACAPTTADGAGGAPCDAGELGGGAPDAGDIGGSGGAPDAGPARCETARDCPWYPCLVSQCRGGECGVRNLECGEGYSCCAVGPWTAGGCALEQLGDCVPGEL